LQMGGLCAQRIVEALKETGVEIDSFDAILDFGCGCGRTIRHFRTLKKAKLYGTDINPKLVDWCSRNLPFGRFGINPLRPPLVYPAEAFDLVYAFSVFTLRVAPVLMDKRIRGCLACCYLSYPLIPWSCWPQASERPDGRLGRRK
jgi:trans-aconitate methyltransferase